MNRNFYAIFTFLMIFGLGVNSAAAQFSIEIPKIKIGKTEKEKNENSNSKVKTNPNTSDNKRLYQNQRPNSTPVLLKNSIYIDALTHDEYWKMKGQRNYSSWIPILRFDHFYDNSKSLNYLVEYFNPDGSPWYSEKLESGFYSAERTIQYKSPSPYGNGVLDTKSTAGTGVYSFKVTDQDTNQVLYQGKFKVAKYNRGYGPQEKNKVGFFVEHDWLLPYATLGFHHSDIEIGGIPPFVSVWLKGMVEQSDLEGRLFYQGKQLATTKENGGVSDYDQRMTDQAPPFAPDKIWKRWQFQWHDFLVDNNGGFNRENYPNAHYADKNPGDYTVKIYYKGAQIREVSFTVGKDGKFVAPAYTNQIFMPYHRMVLPVKVLGTEKWDAASWKTDSFYGNPLTGFSLQ